MVLSGKELGETLHGNYPIHTDLRTDEGAHAVTADHIAFLHIPLVFFLRAKLFPKDPLKFVDILVLQPFHVENLVENRKIPILRKVVNDPLLVCHRRNDSRRSPTVHDGVLDVDGKRPVLSSQDELD